MATKKANVSSARITYGFPGADCPDFDSALIVARAKFRELQKKYGDKLIERWDTSVEKGETSVWLNAHIRVDS